MRAALVACLVLAATTAAFDSGSVELQSGAAAAHWTGTVRRVTLANGLTVLLLQRGTLPIVSVEALYTVGSRNERPGLSGAAHFIEHMAFRRTERINKIDLTNQVLRWGGHWGGYTSYDQTVYNSHAPAAQLDWLLFMERQRLQHVRFDAESVDLERTSVISELRQYEGSPQYTLSEHRLRRAALVAHPYGSPIMGWLSDLERVTAPELEAFYRQYYRPGNLVLAIVGRFDEAETLEMVRRHFADAPSGGRTTIITTTEPQQDGPRRVVQRGPGATSHLELLVHAPAATDRRYPAFLVLDAVLAGGKAEGREEVRPGGRLHEALVATGSASAVATDVELTEYPGLHGISVTAAPDANLADLEAQLTRTLAAVARDAREDEVRRAGRQVALALVLRDDSNAAIADRLARFEGVGSYMLLPQIAAAVTRVTAGDVRAVAADLFAPDRQDIGLFVPRDGPATKTDDAAPSRDAPTVIAQRHSGTATPPPAPLAIPALPPVSTTRLPNGLRVGLARAEGDLVHVRLRIEAGALHDPPGREGLAILTARALAARRTEAAGALSQLGLSLAASADALDEKFDNRLFVEWTVAARRSDLREVIRALEKFVSSPPPADAELAPVRTALAAELAGLQDDARWRADLAAWSALYPADHPLGRAVGGNRESLSAITARDAAAFMRSHYHPLLTTIAIAGDLTDADLRPLLTGLAGWKPDVAAGAPPALHEPPPVDRWPASSGGAGRELRVALPHKEQTSLTVALSAVDATHDDYPALCVLNYLLGQTGYSGRLGETLVDTGLAYAVYARLWPYRGAGPLLVATDTARPADAVARIRDALAAFAGGGVTPAQLEEAQGFVLGRLLFRFETPAAASAAVADLAGLGQDAASLQRFGERVRNLTAAEVSAVAARYYDPARAVFVRAGR